jgi:hypothetical protein
LSCAPSAFTRNKLELLITSFLDYQRLHHTMDLNGLSKLFERIMVKLTPRLKSTRTQPFDWQML